MRRIAIWIIVLATCFGPLTDSSPLSLDPIKRLARVLPYWQNDPTIGPAARAVQHRLKNYYQWRQLATDVVRGSTLQLDIIGQTHLPPNIIPISRGLILTSQRNVYARLVKLKPAMIGLEGWHVDSVDVAGALSGLNRRERREYLATHGDIKYLDRHRRTVGLGVEDSSLHLLQLQILDLDYDIAEISRPRYDAIDRLRLIVLDARSQLAVDRIVIGMHRQGHRRAALVIGSEHRDACLNEAKRLGLLAEFHRASTFKLADK